MSASVFLLVAAVPLVAGIVALGTGSVHTHDGHNWITYHRPREPIAYWLWVSFSLLIGAVLFVVGLIRIVRGAD